MGPQPAVAATAILTREGVGGPQVLLVQRRPEVRSGGGLYCLPGKTIEWGEDAREAAIRACRAQTGLEVEVARAFDAHSNFHDPERLSVGTWFLVKLRSDSEPEPVPGGEAAEATFFPLHRLPDLAFPNDQLVLERLRDELHPGDGDLEISTTELMARLQRRRQRFRYLLEAYNTQLMRGAWINELHVLLSQGDKPSQIAEIAAAHLAARQEVDEVLVWFPGPPDRCNTCDWRDRCPRDQCLHLTAQERQAHDAEPGRDTPLPAAEIERLPLLQGVPAADVALNNATRQAELPGAGAQPRRFEGFPLEIGEKVPGVLGLISQAPIEANARRLFELVARHVGTLVSNATLVENLRAANNVKRSFIERLSHELKTPLTAILSIAELLREELVEAGDEPNAAGAHEIEQSGRMLLGMVESILEIAKLESGFVNLHYKQVNLAELIEADLAAYRQRAERKGLEFGYELDLDAESSTVWADGARVREVIAHLVDNALKFTSEGSVRVHFEPGEAEVTCVVSDTGIGIAPENQREIFESFQQVSEGIHLQYGGLGLGLAQAKVLVELMGGRIWVESSPGEGSTFSFSLPRYARAK
ncbi:MAG: NUDIX domain-containing protein [Planctomycetes bacterium]|nr:NUDIX domain-containing protein [Planctomycetota bacterium]